MSASYLNDNEVFSIVRTKIISALTYFGVTGFDVRRFAQANFNHGDCLVLLNHVRTEREGWQSAKFRNESSVFSRVDTWCETQTYQISVLKKMNSNDTVATLTADDVANRLIAWFNGIGIDIFKDEGLQLLLIDPESVIVYNDDSDLYQRRPVFEVRIIVNKKFSASQPATDILGVRTKPV